ncbi:MAG: hypothetical protein IKJ19_03405 [Clostridia bacterium]|nr:hypothetical protein [Clostridia bacterium]
MRKFVKMMALMLSVLLVSVFGLTACGGTGTNPNKPGPMKPSEVDENTITIKVVKAGFGVDWVYELKDKFEAAFAEEGYKLNIMTPAREINGDNVIRELYDGYNETKVDLYITGDVIVDKVGEKGEYGVLVEELSDLVYDEKPISYDGTEEELTISEKLSPDVVPFITDSTGKVTGFNWVQSSAGLVVNTRKLAQYGITQLPRTTDEMFAAFEAIYLGANGVGNSIVSKTYPITYVPGTANGYAKCFLNTLMAQYSREFYDQFWSFEDAQGNNLSDADAQNLFKHEAVKEMLNVAYRTFDKYIAAPGSTNQRLDQAQAKMMGNNNGAVFMFNGDWFLNEVKLNYPTVLGDIDFINFPVVSALGKKLFGAGTSYNLSDAKADELLSYIIGLVDENKSIEEIISAVQTNKDITLAQADAQEVARARGVSYSRGVEHIAYITKGTPKKEIAAKLLRMMASDDFGKTFTRLANGATPYYAEVITDSEYAFVNNSSKIPANNYFSLISARANGYRFQLLGTNAEFTSIAQGHIPNHVVTTLNAGVYKNGEKIGSIDEYFTAATTLLNNEYQNVVNNWQAFKNKAGLN